MSFLLRLRMPALAVAIALVALCPAQLRFSVSFPAESLDEVFDGRVVVYLSTERGEPRHGPNWFSPDPIYSAIFEGVRPGQAMVVSDSLATGFPGKISQIPEGEYTVQAVIDRNLGGRAIGSSPGNLYSEPVRIRLSGAEDREIAIVCDRLVPQPQFRDTVSVRGVRLESELLGRFYGRPTFMNAAVVLPEAYDKEPERRFPIVYSVPGFGGTHMGLSGRETRRGTIRAGEPFLFVVLDPSCPTGHTVFADSENNGPWGEALTTELIPHIERTYRAAGRPEGRFVTGHSSGGWSSLWLQVTYPQFFGGVWSTAPDPIDFRDFQRIDIYDRTSNMFVEADGSPRPIARRGNQVAILYRTFSDMERPIRGEQLGSFEAVFSPRGADGEPMKLWDRETGRLDPDVAKAWRKYDIGTILRTRWKELEPDLAGKLHIYMGDMDTFYLEGAVRLVKADLERLGAREKVEIMPGDHSSIMNPALLERIDREMAERWRTPLPRP